MGIYNLNNKQPFETYEGYKDPKIAEIIDEISKAVVAGNCFGFVGAGVSMRSGLPGWREFIKYLAKEFNQPGEQNGKLIQQYLDWNDLISAAELIRRSTERPDFHRVAADFFKARRAVPDDVHRFITRTGFQKIITTNYDDLLRDAMKESEIIELDELNRDELSRDGKSPESTKLISGLISVAPAIVKVHGTCESPQTMIITRQDYLDAYSGGYLINWLRTNLIQKSFLFVGYSLGDYDIVNLIKEARATVSKRDQFGRHFAIVDAAGTSPAHQSYLEGCYNIRTVADNIRGDRSVLRRIFAYIHGMCALKEATGETFAIKPPFALQSTVENVCKSIRRAAGADYIALYLTEDVDKINLFGVFRWTGPSREHFPYKPGHGRDENPPTEELKRMYLSMRDCNYYYAGEMGKEDRKKFDIPDVASRSMNSVLIMPVASQGKKVGVLVVGSVIERAFTPYHYDALAIHARIIAEAYKGLLKKLNTVLSAQRGIGHDEAMSLLLGSRLLKSMLQSEELKFILYAVDYEKGLLTPQLQKDMTRKGDWQPLKSTETYLASVALNSGATLHFKNRAEALQYVREHENVVRGLDFFEVTGNLYITPIRSNGYISTILVCWNNEHHTELRYTAFERVKRIVRILFNNFKDEAGDTDKPAVRFLKDLSGKMDQLGHDGGEDTVWKEARTNHKLVDPLVRSVLAALVTDISKLTRVRLWVRTKPKGLDAMEGMWDRVTKKSGDALDGIQFQIKYFDANPKALPEGETIKDAGDKYLGVKSAANDEYTLNTLDRYAIDPYAREIDPSSDGVTREDKNADKLGKDPNGSWLTVPLVYREKGGKRRLQLIGFLSADDHAYSKEQRRYIKSANKADTAAALLAFQRCALDLAAHIVAPLIKAKYFDSPSRA